MAKGDFAGLRPEQQNWTPGTGPAPAVLPSIDQRRWQTCPVCFGKGIVPQGFYAVPGFEWSSTSTAPDQCRSCDGKGVLR